MNYNIIIILGPTATGKTALSVGLAKALNTEIINADSTQVYKQLNIGTAKATPQEMDGVTHHLMDFLQPNQEFSVSQFKQMAMPIILNLQKQNKIPIVVGGTGFYLDSLINNYNYANSLRDDQIRQKYDNYCKEFGKKALFELLKQKDAETAQKLHENDVKRVIRALEIYDITGITKSQHEKQNTMQTSNSNLKPLIIGLTMPRELLYNKINYRTDVMLGNGLLQEVQNLHNCGYTSDLQSIKSIGYKELYDYINGNCSLEQATELIKQNTRNYAKRQITWFKRNKQTIWFDVSKQSIADIKTEILKMLK